MAINPQKKQRQLAKKKAKRKVAIATKVANKIGDLFSSTAVGKLPMYECLAPTELFESRMGTVIIARQFPNGDIGAGFFLLDVFCLGVKSAFFTTLTPQEYQQKLQEIRQHENMQNFAPACARKLIEESVAYANNLGLDPDPDYQKAKRVFGNIQTNECIEEFEFGKDGKPFYITGPLDTPGKTKKIIKQLTKTCGPDGFHVMIGLNDFEEEDDEEEFDFFEDDDDDDEEEVEFKA